MGQNLGIICNKICQLSRTQVFGHLSRQQKNYHYNIPMQKGKKKGGKCPTYLGLFAVEPKEASKQVRTVCREALELVLKRQRPQAYLQQGQEPHQQSQDKHELQTQATEEELVKIEKDFADFESFTAPNDNYHCTSLFIGGQPDRLKKPQKTILQDWKHGVKEVLHVNCIVYVPNYIMTGYIDDTKGHPNDNTFPHMTLLLKNKASAKESNDVLEILHKSHPEILKQRTQRITALHIPYNNVSRIIYVIDVQFDLPAVTGDNFQYGRK